MALPAEMVQPRGEPGGLGAAFPLLGCTQWVAMGSNREAVSLGLFFALSRKILLKSITAQLWSHLPQDFPVHNQIGFKTPSAGSGFVCWDKQRDPGVPGRGGLSQGCSCAISSEKEVWGHLETGLELGEMGGPPAEHSWGERNREQGTL